MESLSRVACTDRARKRGAAHHDLEQPKVGNQAQPTVRWHPFVPARARIETDLDALDADIAVYGDPFDEGSPFLAGSRAGPRSIREHSLRFAATDLGMYDPETRRTYLAYEMANRTIADVGDVDVWPTDVKSTFDNATDLTSAVLAKGGLAGRARRRPLHHLPDREGLRGRGAAARHPL